MRMPAQKRTNTTPKVTRVGKLVSGLGSHGASPLPKPRDNTGRLEEPDTHEQELKEMLLPKDLDEEQKVSVRMPLCLS